MHGRVDGKVTIVTGGSSGLGKAIVMRLAEEGAKVYIFDIADSEQVIEEAGKKGYKVNALKVNIANKDDVVVSVNEVLNREDHAIDILINNAGIISNHENLLTVTEEIWNKEIGVNLTGAFFCSQAVMQGMIDQKYGKIVNISSIGGDTGRPSASVSYSASKAGIYGMTMSIAKTVAKHGINVNAVCPGPILTGIHDSYPPEVLEGLLKEIPYIRGGTPEDIANAVLFLSSGESDYITGARIRVNGGAWMG